jgi:hypothetical protein
MCLLFFFGQVTGSKALVSWKAARLVLEEDRAGPGVPNNKLDTDYSLKETRALIGHIDACTSKT